MSGKCHVNQLLVTVLLFTSVWCQASAMSISYSWQCCYSHLCDVRQVPCQSVTGDSAAIHICVMSDKCHVNQLLVTVLLFTSVWCQASAMSISYWWQCCYSHLCDVRQVPCQSVTGDSAAIHICVVSGKCHVNQLLVTVLLFTSVWCQASAMSISYSWQCCYSHLCSVRQVPCQPFERC